MESHGLPGHIQVTEAVYESAKDEFAFEERGVIDVKGKGPTRTYLLVGRRSAGRDGAEPVGRGTPEPLTQTT